MAEGSIQIFKQQDQRNIEQMLLKMKREIEEKTKFYMRFGWENTTTIQIWFVGK